MRYASSAYKYAMNKQFRDRSYAIVSIGIINNAAQDNSYVFSDSEYFSDNETLFNPTTVCRTYATFEENQVRADGSCYFIPRNNELYQPLGKTSYVSEGLLGELEIRFGETYDLRGLTIDFGESYPTEFTVTYSGGTRTYTNNQSKFITRDSFNETDYIYISPISFVDGNNKRLRINSILMGVGIIFTNDDISSISFEQKVSYITEEIPSATTKIEVLDPNNLFNVDDENSYTSYLREGQRLNFSIGQTLENGTVEYIDMPTAYLSTWSNSRNHMSFTGVDRFAKLDMLYDAGYYIHTRTLYDDAVAVLAFAGLEPDEYFVDTCLQDITVVNPLPKDKVSVCLQLIANAGRCSLLQSQKGKIEIKGNFENIISPVDLVVHATGESDWSNASNVRFGSTVTYADFTSSFVPANGSMVFIPRTADYLNSGYVSSEIADSNGKFTNDPTLELELPSKSTYFGLSLKFGGNHPTRVKVNLYYDSSELDEFELNITDNEVYLSRDLINFNRIKFTVITGVPNNRVLINLISLGTLSDYKLDKFNMTDVPTGTYDNLVKNVSVRVCSFEEVQGEEGLTLVDDSVYYTHQINSEGEQVTYQNQLISTPEHAELVCKWLANYYKNNIIYKVGYRGDPILDASDIIYLDNDNDLNLMTEIESLNLKFNGALSGELNLRRATNMLQEEEDEESN